ncbi:MAG: hypothetical protein ACYCZO_02710 [Daejeonella sp.]
MKKEFARQLFSIVFLFIFFAKMVISAAPLVADHINSEVVNAVIMQLEMENHSAKSPEKSKDCIDKGEWLSGFSKYNFSRPQIAIASKGYAFLRHSPIQAFYPPVPTPPPNC